MAAPAKRHRLSVDERRAQLLELALDLFSNHTYEQLSIDDIARAAGISKGLLYHYFPGKRAFYLAAVEHAVDQLLQETDAASRTHEGVSERSELPTRATVESDVEVMRAGIGRYLEFVEKRSASYIFLLRGTMASDPAVQAIVEKTRRAFLDRMAQGIGPAGDPAKLRTALRGYIGFVEAASLDWLEHGDLSRGVLADIMVNVCVSTVSSALS